MADVKISNLGAIASVAGEDLIAIVDDPGVTPASRKATMTQVLAFINANISALSNIVEDTTPDLGGTLTGSGFDQTGMGTISMTEQANANADVAGDGQMWVKTATPNQIWFTDDAGTDFQLATLTGTETLTGKSIVSSQLTGIIADAQMPNLTGAITTVEGAVATTLVAESVDSDHYVDGSIDNIHVATGLDAVKLADGTVTNAELQYINTLSSNAQSQLDLKATLASPALTSPSISYAINAQTGTTYTSVLTDAGKIITTSNGSAITFTIPPNSSVAYPIGSSLTVISIGAGLTTFAQGSGVTIASTGATATAPIMRIQHSSATAIKIGTDLWQVVGDIS
jgi:hypothetical protein